MQSIKSFTALASILGRNRTVRFDELAGLTIPNLTEPEAAYLVAALEQLPAPATRRTPAVVAPAPKPAVVMPPTPEPVTVAPTAAETVRAQPADTTPAPALGETVQAPPAQSVTVEPDLPPADIVPPEPAPQPKRKRKAKPKPKHPTQPETRPQERQAPKKKMKAETTTIVLPDAGQDYGGTRIVSVKDHSDGGRLLVLESGVRVKLDRAGTEIVRSDAGLPDVSDIPTAAAGMAVPDEVLQSRMTRDVVQYLIDSGVTEKEAIVAACVGLKDKGALAFAASKDEEAVRRRVTSQLTVMGRA
jgi:hypothetical protein